MNKNSVHDGAALLNGDRVSSTLAAIPYARHLGVRVAEFSEAGAVVFHLPFEERLVGNVTLPALHGGVIAAFMLGGFKSEVQHLPPSKVRRCKAPHPSAINSFSLKTA
ncbi:MAG: hypothetical protein KKG11_09810 [Gammaproteobacteria bacterium]|nr:hypothetical protein [Gammaproteobacteria bacterium]MBU4505531.1 hypothetical protein [Gammaproteobacteria bacterium]